MGEDLPRGVDRFGHLLEDVQTGRTGLVHRFSDGFTDSR